jgi:hypothetical protein
MPANSIAGSLPKPVAGNGNVGNYYRRIEPLRKDYPLGKMLEVYSFKF